MQDITWYLNRARRMSPSEMGYRMARLAGAFTGRLWPTVRVPTAAIPDGPGPAPWISVPDSMGVEEYRAAADRLIQGIHSVFELDAVRLGHPPRWNRDPLTGTIAPLRHAAAIDYRDSRVVGDIKHLWEPNRHLHLVTLAQAWALTGEQEYADALRIQLMSWFEQCPYPRGPNWSSALELGVRLINWSACWQLLGGPRAAIFRGLQGRAFRAAWLDSIYLHARYIMRNLSRYSSANNHLLGELAGVFVASRTWPCWPDLEKWGASCQEALLDEALKQVAPDGGNREQAVAYQLFVLDFLLVAGLAARRTGKDFSAEYWRRIEAMVAFVASLMDAGGHLPMIGDADDGHVLRLSAEQGFSPGRSLIATGAVLFNRSDLATRAARYDDKSAWLLASESGEASFRGLLEANAQPHVPKTSFPHSGYYLLGSDFGTDHEVRLLADAGPLGYLSIAAHGHADALSILLSVGGEEVLVDPGTYCYQAEPEWRAYFRGTSAHNTITVDGEDQSVQAGSFLWSRHAHALCTRFDPGLPRQVFSGEHHGYRRLKDPVIHSRTISYDARAREFQLEDILSCEGAHEVVRHWHFAEPLSPERREGEWQVRTKTALICLSPQETLEGHEALRGSADPFGGWVSRAFATKMPATTLRWKNLIQGTTVLTTRIKYRFDA